MRPTFRTEALPILLVLASWLLTAVYWSQLPPQMPTHWGPSGRPDAWMPLPFGALIGPMVATFSYLLLLILPFIDPRSQHWESFRGAYAIVKDALLALFCGLTYLSLSAAVRPDQSLDLHVLLVAMGLLFVVLGNYMPKLRSNFFVGVRTPWTLSDEDVWYRTHRLAGKLMMAAGLVTVLAAWLPAAWSFAVMMGAVMAMSLISVGYSFWLFQRRHGMR